MKKETIRILFTSVGRRVELMQAYRDAAVRSGIPCLLYGVDISENAPALQYCDRTELICRINDPNYIPSLVEICRREKITAVVPTIDTDLLLLARRKDEIEATGAKVLISAPEKIAVCRDKRYTADYFISCGLKSPKPVDRVEDYHGPFPCFIKPKDGSSSINAYKVENAEDLQTYANNVDDYIIQPFISGREYTIDIFCDFDGNPIYITPRERLAVRSGEVLKTRIEQDAVMIEECRRLIADFKPCGPMTVQLIRETATGDNYYIEINPRYGGGAPLSVKAGADSPMALLRLLSGETVGEQPLAATENSVFSRFDQSICVSAGAFTAADLKAVVFDLDDTLYGEKEYVQSGFRAVAAQLPELPDAYDRLWTAFQNGQSAIDTVLGESGLYTEERRQNCLTAYREQKPDINFYPGAENLLIALRKKGYRIGVLTDGRPSGQRAKIAALGLEKMVDDIVVTDELGGPTFRKPNDLAFRLAAKRLNVAFREMMYVGDNAGKDFVAPKTLGIRSAWVRNADGLYDAQSGSADLCFGSLSELADWFGLK